MDSLKEERLASNNRNRNEVRIVGSPDKAYKYWLDRRVRFDGAWLREQTLNPFNWSFTGVKKANKVENTN